MLWRGMEQSSGAESRPSGGPALIFVSYASQVEFRSRDIPSHWMDEATAFHLFGIGREAIFNAFRHSRSRTIQVTCDHTDETICLVIEDDGVGMDPSSRDGIGIPL